MTASGGLDPDPDRVAAVLLACPSVAALSGGAFGQAATYLPGRRVTGVRIGASDDPHGVTVNVVGRYGPTIAEIAAEVRSAVAGLVAPHPVDVVIDDLATSAGLVIDPDLASLGADESAAGTGRF